MLYPLVFGTLLLSKERPRPFLLSGQGIEVYILVVVLLRAAWVVRNDVKARSSMPVSYIKIVLVSLPIVGSGVVASLLIAFGLRWATI